MKNRILGIAIITILSSLAFLFCINSWACYEEDMDRDDYLKCSFTFKK